MNFRDLQRTLPEMKARGSVTVEFVPGVEDLECYPEKGMRATVISVVDDNDTGVLKLRVSYEKFDEYNKSFESYNYFDKARQPVLNARSAGYYTVEETIYVMANDKIEKYMRVLYDNSTALYDAYRLEAPGISYTLWLENKVMGEMLAC